MRDALLGRLGERPDLDLVVEGDALALARGLARRYGASCVVLDAERSIARLVIQGWSFDLARRMGESLEQDLARRDYSVNAIALPLAALCGGEGDPIDPGGGLADLRARRMRALRCTKSRTSGARARSRSIAVPTSRSCSARAASYRRTSRSRNCAA